ncbi:hypothetical protein N7493_003615 [Penicillium malachiteum]|uniref:Secreted protein CSS2 C-terminal domain-containing protein n=1 Tax=Penicillium malachiteum TaxID=1324776 RepID=A0AAD6HQB1_9EURO|nr:hypothetical protein N7493_003615 [Penicillium malachiteum]
MVNTSKIVSCLLALGLVDTSAASYDRTNQTVTYAPIFKEWREEGTNENMTMTATFDLVNSNYVYLYEDANYLHKRTAISVAVEVATILGGTAGVIMAAESALDIYEYIAGVIKTKAEQESCTLTYGTDTADDAIEGYAYKAMTTKTNCGTTAEKKTIDTAVKKCANELHEAGATRGCCKFRYGDGSWYGHLRLTAEPKKYPADTVNC